MLRSGHMERAQRPPFLGGSAKASFLLAQHTKAGYRGSTAARKISGAARKISRNRRAGLAMGGHVSF
jgi:hypothetical protein